MYRHRNHFFLFLKSGHIIHIFSDNVAFFDYVHSYSALNVQLRLGLLVFINRNEENMNFCSLREAFYDFKSDHFI